MAPALNLTVDEIRAIIDHAHNAVMSGFPPVKLPSERDLREGEAIFAAQPKAGTTGGK